MRRPGEVVRLGLVAAGLVLLAASPAWGACDTSTTSTSTSTTTSTQPCGLAGFWYCAPNASCPDGGTCAVRYNSGCFCISPLLPCGDTWPACNGTCPQGQRCQGFSTNLQDICGCVPEGEYTPCGLNQVGLCGGGCPAGRQCFPMYNDLSLSTGHGCGCDRPIPCEMGGGECQSGHSGERCVKTRTTILGCQYNTCGFDYPTCGGSCGSVGCQAVRLAGALGGACVCAQPIPCDASLGGYVCPPGLVCEFDAATSARSCVAP